MPGRLKYYCCYCCWWRKPQLLLRPCFRRNPHLVFENPGRGNKATKTFLLLCSASMGAELAQKYVSTPQPREGGGGGGSGVPLRALQQTKKRVTGRRGRGGEDCDWGLKMPLDVSHLPPALHPYLWGGTAAMVAEASTFPIGNQRRLCRLFLEQTISVIEEFVPHLSYRGFFF